MKKEHLSRKSHTKALKKAYRSSKDSNYPIKAAYGRMKRDTQHEDNTNNE